MKNLYLLLSLTLIAHYANAQVGIGTVSPNSTLDVRGSVSASYRSYSTATTTLTASDYTVVYTGAVATTATLPDATTCTGRVYGIKNFSATTPVPKLTVATVSSQTIDGSGSWALDEPNEAILIVSDGANWKVSNQDVPVAKTTTTGGPWNEGGNKVPAMKSVGTITNFSLPIITNNLERMRVDSMGNVAIGGQIASGATNAEKLLINAGTTTSPNLISAIGSINNYLQVNLQNTAATGSASTDLIATNNGGSYIDLGINSSGYNLNVSPILNGANNAYLYTTGNDFIIGDSTVGKNLIFFTGGAALTNERMRINSGGNVGIGNNNPLAALDVNGTVKIGTAGTVLNAVMRFTNQSVTDNTTFNFNQVRTETFTLTGVNQNASIIVTPRSALPVGLGIAYAYASATNTVQVVILNASGATIALGTIVFDFTVIQ